MENIKGRSKKILELLDVPRFETKCSSPKAREQFLRNKEKIKDIACSGTTNSNVLKNKINIINVVTLKSDNFKEDIKINANLDNNSNNENRKLLRAKRNLFGTHELAKDNINRKDTTETFKAESNKNDAILQWLDACEIKTQTEVATPETKMEENSFSENESMSDPSIFKDSGSEFIPSHSGSESDTSERQKNIGVPSRKQCNLRKRQEKQYKEEEMCNTRAIKKNKIGRTDRVKVKNKIKNTKPEIKLDEVSNKEKKQIKQQSNNVEKICSEVEFDTSLHSINKSHSDSSVGSESEISIKNVSIEISKTNVKSGKRIQDKVHCCFFCDKLLINIARHYKLLHKNEVKVAKILSMPKGSKARTVAFDELHKFANFHHNCEVLNQNKGELILVRRPSHKETPFQLRDYGPCPNCPGFMLKKRIWFHLKYHCKVKVTSSPPKNHRNNIIAESTALLVGMSNNTFSQEYKTNILAKFQNDEISDNCRTDDVILKFGWSLFEKFGTTQNDLIRQQMRQLSRFLLEIKNLSTDIKCIGDCLLPSQFDSVIAATKNMCGDVKFDIKRPEFKVPSLALKIGHSLKKCAFILRGIALRKGLTKQNDLYFSFLTLMDMEWSSKISSRALSTLHKRKFNHKQLLPLTEDLVHLTTYLDKEMSKLMEKLQKDVQYKTWRDLASITLSRVILFNKKRSGEAARMTIEQYATRPTIEENTQELLMSLSPLEKKLVTIMEVVDIEGKRGKSRPVIITPKIKSSIDILFKTRTNVDISKKNLYIFCPINNENGHLRGYECLKTACNEANLRQPELITGTKLRKYVATVSQIFNLGENECDWLARHMGHDIKVHRNFYRLHENTVETTKVSRLLLAIEKGQANKFAGKTLDEITVEELPSLEEDDDEGEGNGEERDGEEYRKGEGEKRVENKIDNDEDDNSVEVPMLNLNKKRKRKKINSDTNYENKKSRKSSKRNPWSHQEIDAILKFFKFDLKKEYLPGKEKCLQCLKEYPVLQNRKWTDVKYYLKNYYAKNKRLLKI